MTNIPKIVKTNLIIASTKDLDDEVAEDLDIPDPTLEEANAALSQSIRHKTKRFRFFKSLNENS